MRIDRSGSLKATEFALVCYDMGLFLDQTEVEAAMHLVDTERNGYVIQIILSIDESVRG